jgi:hypothetical protein
MTLPDPAALPRRAHLHALDGAVAQRHTNGLLQYVFTTSRGNYLALSRDQRALPET